MNTLKRTNQKHRNLVGSDQQMQKRREAGRRVGVNCNIFYPIFRQARPDFLRVCLQLRRKDVTI